MKLLPPIPQKGYIQIVLVVFAVLIGLMIFPLKFPTKPEVETGECLAGVAPLSEEIIRIAEPVYDQAKFYEATDEYVYIGTPDPARMGEYILIRQNVLAPEVATTKNWLVFGTNPLTGLAHSVPFGEDPQKPGYTLYYPTSPGEFLFKDGTSKHLRDEGLVLFRNNDPASIRSIEGKVYYTVDVYQIKGRFDDPNKGYETEDLFSCAPDSPMIEEQRTSVVFPDQETSMTREQLQLEWFLFQGGGGLWGVHCKPAVYLYPSEKKLVNVKVFPKGELSYTDPPYDVDYGWTVEAYPDGRLIPNAKFQMPNAQYSYLYYESKILDSEIKKPSKGWTVKKNEMEELFDTVLPELGLNQKEANDFKEYWLTKLPESPYYFVGLMDKSQRDYLEPLEVIPNPDTSIRFSLYFEPLNEFRSVTEPEITTPERTGFTLVDWGGMIKLHPGTPFTCSQ